MLATLYKIFKIREYYRKSYIHLKIPKFQILRMAKIYYLFIHFGIECSVINFFKIKYIRKYNINIIFYFGNFVKYFHKKYYCFITCIKSNDFTIDYFYIHLINILVYNYGYSKYNFEKYLLKSNFIQGKFRMA